MGRSDEDETNTVIENECDNDYQNLYHSIEIGEQQQQLVQIIEDDEETIRKREFEMQK